MQQQPNRNINYETINNYLVVIRKKTGRNWNKLYILEQLHYKIAKNGIRVVIF